MMDRRNFIRSCGYACLGGLVGASVVSSCGTAKSVNASLSGDSLLVPLSSFVEKKNGQQVALDSIIVHNDQLKRPLYVSKLSENIYTAVLMECTHKGAELQVSGDLLLCNLHGSEFNRQGAVKTGPASTDLRSFPVVVEKGRLKIRLTSQ